MKIQPIAINHIIIETENGQLIDVNDGGRLGLHIRAVDFQEEVPVVRLDDFRVIITFRKREIEEGKK